MANRLYRKCIYRLQRAAISSRHWCVIWACFQCVFVMTSITEMITWPTEHLRLLLSYWYEKQRRWIPFVFVTEFSRFCVSICYCLCVFDFACVVIAKYRFSVPVDQSSWLTGSWFLVFLYTINPNHICFYAFSDVIINCHIIITYVSYYNHICVFCHMLPI